MKHQLWIRTRFLVNVYSFQQTTTFSDGSMVLWILFGGWKIDQDRNCTISQISSLSSANDAVINVGNIKIRNEQL